MASGYQIEDVSRVRHSTRFRTQSLVVTVPFLHGAGKRSVESFVDHVEHVIPKLFEEVIRRLDLKAMDYLHIQTDHEGLKSPL